MSPDYIDCEPPTPGCGPVDEIRPQTRGSRAECDKHFEQNKELYAMIPTAHLVRELSGREGVTVEDVSDVSDIQIIYFDLSLGATVDHFEGLAVS